MIRKAAAIIINKNKILLVKSRKGNIFISPGGKYEIINGRIETPEECLSRELREELQIEISTIRHYKDYNENVAVFDKEPLLLETYFVTIFGEPLPSSEIKSLYWATVNEIENGIIETASGIKRFAPELKADGYLQ